MLYLVAFLAGLSVSLLIVFVAQLAPSRPAGLARQLDELRRASGVLGRDNVMKERAEQLALLLQNLGERVAGHRRDEPTVRLWLIQAGYLNINAVAIYWGARLGLVLALAGAGAVVAPLFKPEFFVVAMAALWMAAIGWIIPPFYVRSRLQRRQKEVQRALPDALDMLVVCVEAGLGLNQALVRVADEIYHVSPLLSEQIIMVNLEIRAGTARDDALRMLAERTGLSDVSSLVAMLIQTDRFGTSVANALRVQATSLRTKRRQRAEEAAAKTAIKLVFPLVLCVFPALFVVILGPAMIQIMETMSGL
ncbi:MAG: type II secretion system F family protein [Gemmatimonadales bacterium]